MFIELKVFRSELHAEALRGVVLEDEQLVVRDLHAAVAAHRLAHAHGSGVNNIGLLNAGLNV